MALDFGGEDQHIGGDQGIPVWRTQGVNDINSYINRQWIESHSPDVIAVCGASLLGPDILALAPRGVLNLHGGLSQFYRGLFTTDWAIHDAVPELIGATVHFITAGIDDGDVVYQGRPTIEADDTPHSLYEKVVRLGAGMMIQAIRDIEIGELKACPLERRGTLCLNSMFTVAVKRKTWRQIEQGVLRHYLADRERRDADVMPGLINHFDGNSVVNDAVSTRRWSG
jgi:methionyl-tRNA formyltransferase